MEVNDFLFYIHLQLDLGHASREVKITSVNPRLGLMGPSGGGKSTLAKSLTGVRKGAQGEVRFKGHTFLNSMEGINLPSWNRKIGYLPQDIHLLPHLNVQQNILFPKNSRLIEEVIVELNIFHLLTRMPRHLSGGEKQRVGLARALCCSPELLVLDEPLSSLDAHTKQTVLAFLNSHLKRHSLPLLMISHAEGELTTLACEIHTL